MFQQADVYLMYIHTNTNGTMSMPLLLLTRQSKYETVVCVCVSVCFLITATVCWAMQYCDRFPCGRKTGGRGEPPPVLHQRRWESNLIMA